MDKKGSDSGFLSSKIYHSSRWTEESPTNNGSEYRALGTVFEIVKNK